MKFKVGDLVRNKLTGHTDVVKQLPGMNEYDIAGYAGADEGMILENSGWGSQKNWELITNSDSQGGEIDMEGLKTKVEEQAEKITELEKELESFKKKVLAPVASYGWLTFSFNSLFYGEDSKPLTLEEKIDALANYLKVNVERVETSKIVVKPTKQVKETKRKYRKTGKYAKKSRKR